MLKSASHDTSHWLQVENAERTRRSTVKTRARAMWEERQMVLLYSAMPRRTLHVLVNPSRIWGSSIKLTMVFSLQRGWAAGWLSLIWGKYFIPFGRYRHGHLIVKGPPNSRMNASVLLAVLRKRRIQKAPPVLFLVTL